MPQRINMGTVPQVKIITMTEDELTAKMEDFRRQIMSDIKSFLAMQPQTKTTSPAKQARSGDCWVSAKELSEKYGVTTTTIWCWAKAGKLPQPAKLADKRCTRWNLAEVEEKLSQQCA